LAAPTVLTHSQRVRGHTLPHHYISLEFAILLLSALTLPLGRVQPLLSAERLAVMPQQLACAQI